MKNGVPQKRVAMKEMLRCGVFLCLLALFPASAGGNDGEKSVDPATGLIVAPGWEEVKGFCTGCHAALLIAQNRADRDGWLALLRWMEKEQGMASLDPEIEKRIIDYLAANYAPGRTFRRPPLEVEFREK
jgi:hypothetical protein